MNWCHREPTLNGILSDPVVRAGMEADGVNRHELEVMLRRVAQVSGSLDVAMKVVRAIAHSQGHKQTLTRPRLAVVPDSRHKPRNAGPIFATSRETKNFAAKYA